MIGVLGATGYTGSLVLAYFAKYVDAAQQPYILGARSTSKLAMARHEAGTPSSVPEQSVDVTDNDSLAAFVSRCTVLLNCVGPFRFYGERVIRACLIHNVHYCDVMGEPAFFLKMISQFDDEARQKGTRIVMGCGFDSVPADLGVLYTEDAAGVLPNERHVVRGSVHFTGPDSLSSGSLSAISHGTYTSLINSFAGGSNKPRSSDKKGDSKKPVVARTKPTNSRSIFYDNIRGRWLMRFPVVDPYIVRRTHQVLHAEEGLAYSHYLEFDSLFAMIWLMFLMAVLMITSKIPLLKRLVNSLKQEGSGPEASVRAATTFEMTFHSSTSSGHPVVTQVRGPEAYDATAVCVAEIALLMAYHGQELRAEGGVYTPGALGYHSILDRISQRGITFQTLKD